MPAGCSGRRARPATPLADALALQDQDARRLVHRATSPTPASPAAPGSPSSRGSLADGTEVLVTARIRRTGGTARSTRVALVLRSARGRARLDRERSDLVATVAHELRSPLTGVKGFVTTLLSKWDRLNDEQKKLMLTTVNTDAERLSRLITELLDVARIDTGRLPLYPREIDAVPVAGPGASSPSRRHQPHDHAPGTRRRAAPRSPTRTSSCRCVTNLVDNAVRHGEGDGLGDHRDPGRCGAADRPSTTRARASPRPCAPGCSRSSGSTAPGAGRGWACTSSTGWSGRTAASWPSRRPRRRRPDRGGLAGRGSAPVTRAGTELGRGRRGRASLDCTRDGTGLPRRAARACRSREAAMSGPNTDSTTPSR